MDKYQRRYLSHQKKKSELLSGQAKTVTVKGVNKGNAFLEVVERRQSQRFFSSKKVDAKQFQYLKRCLEQTPSSCNRQAIKIRMVRSGADKRKIESLLVGGAGWVSGADTILLLFADMSAYKSPAEVDFMPYLDAGFIGMTVYYACEAIGLGCCFVNPNIRPEKKQDFDRLFNDGYRFCGACVIGHYESRTVKYKKTKDIFLKKK